MADQAKLEHAAVYAMWRYTLETDETRVQRPLHPADIPVLSTLIADIGKEYQAAKGMHGKGADFQSCLHTVIDTQSYDRATRNFFASTLATYFRWQQRKYQHEYLQKIPYLDRLAAFRDHLAPPHQ